MRVAIARPAIWRETPTKKAVKPKIFKIGFHNFNHRLKSRIFAEIGCFMMYFYANSNNTSL
ncbi:MAG: hypothetical protein Q7U59_00520 [Lutibacter sp.]|nr:hypothetical protein [Lutibacter sp.]